MFKEGGITSLAKKPKKLKKAYLKVHLDSAQIKERVADELVRSKVNKTRQVLFWKRNTPIPLGVDEMPTSQDMDILITVEMITEEDLKQLVVPLIRQISGVREVEPVIPLSHNGVQSR